MSSSNWLNASQINGTISGNVIGNGTANSGSRDMYGIATSRGRWTTFPLARLRWR